MDGINAGEVCNALRRWAEGFNFLLPGVDRSLGRDIVNQVAQGIADRSAVDEAPDGSEWERNMPDYREDKEKSYGWPDNPNRRTGQMLSLESLKGRPVIEKRHITMVYGTGDPPAGCYSPHDKRTQAEIDADEDVTDVEKAEWAHAGDEENNRPARPFYGLDPDIEKDVTDMVADQLRKYIQRGL